MKRWTPKIFTSRRIAGRVLRVSRAGGLELSAIETQLCIDGITSKFLSTSLRQQLGTLWYAYGETVVGSGLEDPERRTPVDDALDNIARG